MSLFLLACRVVFVLRGSAAWAKVGPCSPGPSRSLGVAITTLVTYDIVQHGAGEDNLVHSLWLQVDFCGEDTPVVC